MDNESKRVAQQEMICDRMLPDTKEFIADVDQSGTKHSGAGQSEIVAGDRADTSMAGKATGRDGNNNNLNEERPGEFASADGIGELEDAF